MIQTDEQISLPRNMVIVLAGATSVGKSAVSMELCKHFPSEIVIADSVQVYRDLNIGANKPTVEEQHIVPHHLIDIANPNEQLSSADFCYRAVEAIRDIISRGKTPILVGGSTMWIQWLIHGIPDAPKASTEAIEICNSLIGELELNNKWEDGLNVLKKYDPDRAGKLAENDWYRLKRGLEICIDLSLRSGKPALTDESEVENFPKLTGERTSLLPKFEFDVRCFFLVEDKEDLYKIIDERCEQMLFAGLFKETAELILNGSLQPEYLITKSIGYRQAIHYFSAFTPAQSLDTRSNSSIPFKYEYFVDFLREFSTCTRNYANAQIKWYRKDINFLFTKIYRNISQRSSFQQSYEHVCDELLTLLRFSPEDMSRHLHDQIQRMLYAKHALSLKTILSGHQCKDSLEFETLLDLIINKQINFRNSSASSMKEEEIKSDSKWIITAEAIEKFKAQQKRGSDSLTISGMQIDLYPSRIVFDIFCSLRF
jgi:tRNA dimethylallyltransferase